MASGSGYHVVGVSVQALRSFPAQTNKMVGVIGYKNLRTVKG